MWFTQAEPAFPNQVVRIRTSQVWTPSELAPKTVAIRALFTRTCFFQHLQNYRVAFFEMVGPSLGSFRGKPKGNNAFLGSPILRNASPLCAFVSFTARGACPKAASASQSTLRAFCGQPAAFPCSQFCGCPCCPRGLPKTHAFFFQRFPHKSFGGFLRFESGASAPFP